MKLNVRNFTRSLFCGGWGSTEQQERSPGAGEKNRFPGCGESGTGKEIPSCPSQVSYGNEAWRLSVGRKEGDQRRKKGRLLGLGVGNLPVGLHFGWERQSPSKA